MSSLTHISNALNRFDERLSAIEADTRGFHNQFDSFVDILEKVCNKLVGIEKMQAKHSSQLDHASAFARRSAGVFAGAIGSVRENLTEHSRILENILEQVESVGADLHEYARQAADELEVYGPVAEPEIDWLNLSIKGSQGL